MNGVDRRIFQKIVDKVHGGDGQKDYAYIVPSVNVLSETSIFMVLENWLSVAKIRACISHIDDTVVEGVFGNSGKGIRVHGNEFYVTSGRLGLMNPLDQFDPGSETVYVVGITSVSAYMNGNIKLIDDFNDDHDEDPLFVFGNVLYENNDFVANGFFRLHRFTVWDKNNEVIADLIPYMPRSTEGDGKVSLKDVISGKIIFPFGGHEFEYHDGEIFETDEMEDL